MLGEFENEKFAHYAHVIGLFLQSQKLAYAVVEVDNHLSGRQIEKLGGFGMVGASLLLTAYLVALRHLRHGEEQDVHILGDHTGGKIAHVEGGLRPQMNSRI